MTTSTPQQEEREARVRVRQLDRARREAARKRERQTGTRLQAVIRDELAKPRAQHCACGFTPRTTMDEIMSMGAGCTSGRWICPVLDAVRRRMGR